MAKPVKKSELSILEKFKESESSASVVFGAIVVIVAGLLIFNFVKGNKEASLLGNGETTELTASQSSATAEAKYVVVTGDNLWKIAEKRYGSGYNWVDVAKANKLSNASILAAGKELVLPAVPTRVITKTVASSPVVTPTVVTTASPITGDSYQVAKGDSLWTIALRTYGDGYKWTSIYQANKKMITDPNRLFVGWTLSLPR